MIWRSTHLLIPALIPAAVMVAMAFPMQPGLVTSALHGDQAATGDTPQPPPPVVRSHPLTDAEVAAAVGTIDRLVSADLAAHDQKPNPPIDEYTFLRRSCLAILGRIPTFQESEAYLTQTGKDRRAKLITALLNQPGRIHHEFTWWADLLRISTRLGDRYPGNAYVDWIKEQIKANTPYDQVVRNLITAQGPALARGNGATGYYLRDAGMPLDNMANTVQVFLGTRVQCAQCHDHPFDKWTRKEFYELAAYTNSVGITRDVKGLGALGKKAKDEGLTPGVRDALRMIGNSIALSVQGGNKPTIQLPHDYQYHDAKPGDTVSAKTLFDPPGLITDGQEAKKIYADWLTSPDNPRFTKVIANRLWKRVFGLGLIEPVDNLTDTTVAVNPELLEFLTKLMRSVDYDVKHFSQILYQTEAWQRAASLSDPAADVAYRFPGPVLRRMSAEQLWDSLLTLAVPELDGRTGESAERLYKFYEDNKGKDAKELFAVAQDLGARRDKIRAIEVQSKDLRTLIENTPNKDSIEARRAKAQLKELNEQREELVNQTDPGRMVGFKKNPKGGPEQFVRADELPSPAPAGHFLRTFGQSDRDVIEGANSGPATTQALTMLNGFIDRELLKERSVLYQEMLKPKDVGSKVDILFLAILTRPPSPAERELGKQEIAHALLNFRKSNQAGAGADVAKESTKAALHNLAWVLLNGNEFLFVQ